MSDLAALAVLDRYWNCRLTTIGRKSGAPRTVTLWFALEAGRVYLAGGEEVPQWCRNLRANPEVSIAIGDATLRGRARLIGDPAEAAAVRERFVERYVLARLSRLFGGYTRSTAVVVDLADGAISAAGS